MRRNLAPCNYNFKRRGGTKKPHLFCLGPVNEFGWTTSGSVSFDTNSGMKLYSDGAWAQRSKILPVNGNFSVRFAFGNSGQGSGNEQVYMYWGDWECFGTYLVMYIRQYSSSDTYMAWKVGGASHTAKGDASHFYVCEKYNWYSTAGTWYQVYFEITNRSTISIKIWPWGAYFEDLPAVWDYQGQFNSNGVVLEGGNIGAYTLATSGNGLGIWQYEIYELPY